MMRCTRSWNNESIGESFFCLQICKSKNELHLSRCCVHNFVGFSWSVWANSELYLHYRLYSHTQTLSWTSFARAIAWSPEMKSPDDMVTSYVWFTHTCTISLHSLVVLTGGPGGRGYSHKNLVGVCGPLPKTLTLFMNKICDFPYPIYDLIKYLIPYLWPDS